MPFRTEEGFVVTVSEALDQESGVMLEVYREGGPDSATLVLTQAEARKLAMGLYANLKYLFEAKVVRVIDADTIELDVELAEAFYISSSYRTRMRLARIDAWEVRGKERVRGLMAKERVEALLPPGTKVVVQSRKTGKYGRWIGEVTVNTPTGDRNLSDLLVEEGHAEYVSY